MRIDLHTHTWPASSCASISHDEYVAFCRESGIKAIALTNHGDIRDNLELEKRLAEIDVVLFHGIEISTLHGDFIVFSPDLDYLATLPDVRAPLRKGEVPDHAAVVWAHPIGGGGRSGSVYYRGLEQAVADVIHAVEVYNGNWSSPEHVDGAAAIAAALDLPMTGGSDAHLPSRLMACYTEVDYYTVADTTDLVAALRQGAVRPGRADAPPRRRGFGDTLLRRKATRDDSTK